MRRRAFLTGTLATAGVLLCPPIASTATRTTVIWTPHPDDETLRLAAYITMAAARGDQLVLVTVTDGEASTACSPLTGAECGDARAAEQAAAVAHLGSMTILRLRLPDGGVSTEAARGACRAIMAVHPGAEHYIACRTDDTHPDHRAVASGVKAAAPAVVRQSYSPTSPGGWPVAPTDPVKVQAAVDVYKAGIAGESVPSLWAALEADMRSWIST